MIFFDNITKMYGQKMLALDNVTLRVKHGEFVSLVGRSGAGKSTLLKLLIAEERPTFGKIFFENDDVHSLRANRLPFLRRRIGVVFQDLKLLGMKTVKENIGFVMEVAGKGKDEIERDVPQILDLVGLSSKFDNFPHELSGGEKQRVAIARAMANRPDVIIADEPTGNLDPLNTWEIIGLLTKINELGTTILLATHDKEVINSLDRRVVSLDNGKIIRDEERGKYVL